MENFPEDCLYFIKILKIKLFTIEKLHHRLLHKQTTSKWPHIFATFIIIHSRSTVHRMMYHRQKYIIETKRVATCLLYTSLT